MTDYTLDALKKQKQKLLEKQKKLDDKIREKEKREKAREQKKLDKKYLVAGKFFLETVLKNQKVKEHYEAELRKLNLID